MMKRKGKPPEKNDRQAPPCHPAEMENAVDRKITRKRGKGKAKQKPEQKATNASNAEESVCPTIKSVALIP